MICIHCGHRVHGSTICSQLNADELSDGAACWCERSFGVQVFRTEEEALAAMVDDIEDLKAARFP